MDTRKVTADFYPGGKSAISAGGGITSGEGGGGSGAPTVPVTPVAELPERYRESDMRQKINELCKIVSGGVALIAAMISFAAFGQVQVQGVKNADLWNDDFVVTNVTVNLEAYAKANDVSSATNALAAAAGTRLAAATNAVFEAAAGGIAAATNELARRIDEKLEASTNGMFNTSMLEDYAKRGWVEAQGYLKETNMNSYAQVDWVQEQGYLTEIALNGYLKGEDLRAYGYITEVELKNEVQREIALQDATGTYRLMIPDRSEWIDGSGVCWRVTSHVQVWDDSFVGKPGDRKWVKDDGRTGVELNENGWLYTRYKTWRSDPENPEATWEERIWDYTGEANTTGGVTTMTITVEDPQLDENGNAPPETLTLSYWLETNCVNRVAYANDLSAYATTDDVAQAISNMSTITTNDVCNIVTNEVTEFTAWSLHCDDPVVQAVLDTEGAPIIDHGKGDFSIAHPNVEGYELVAFTFEDLSGGAGLKLRFGGLYYNPDGEEVDIIATRELITKRNALGLARLKDLEGKADASITNEVVEYVWVYSCEIPEIEEALNAAKPSPTFLPGSRDEDGMWEINNPPSVEGYVATVATSAGIYPETATTVEFSNVYGVVEDAFNIGFTATRERITRNALGLARLKDLEPLPTYEAVTNTARDVSNTFWDEKNSVLWKIAFKDGEPMFLPLTNENVSVTGGAQ